MDIDFNVVAIHIMAIITAFSPVASNWVTLYNPFCNNHYIMTINVNAVATHIVVIITFSTLLQISLQQCYAGHIFKMKNALFQEKRKRSDSALWQKPLHWQKNPKSNVTTQRTPPKTSITQRLRTDLGRSAGVTIATQLVWLNQFTGSQPSHSPQQLCNRGHEQADIILQWAESWI